MDVRAVFLCSLRSPSLIFFLSFLRPSSPSPLVSHLAYPFGSLLTHMFRIFWNFPSMIISPVYSFSVCLSLSFTSILDLLPKFGWKMRQSLCSRSRLGLHVRKRPLILCFYFFMLSSLLGPHVRKGPLIKTTPVFLHLLVISSAACRCGKRFRSVLVLLF